MSNLGPRSTPTERQYRMLLSLGSGSAGLSRTKRDTEPLRSPPYYQWVRITADGLRALALAVERHGLPEMTGGSLHVKTCLGCGRKWRPKCRCGSDSFRYEPREVERDVA